MPPEAKVIATLPRPHIMSPRYRDRYTDLRNRGETLGTSSVNPLVMAVTGEWLSGHRRPYLYLPHPAVDDKPAYLASVWAEIAQGLGTGIPARMLKTVTLKFKSGDITHRVLVGTIGRSPVDDEVKRKIAADFGLSRKVAKGASVNPPDGWDPAEQIKLEAGVVGPLLDENAGNAVSAYYFLEEKFDRNGPVVPVELALSPKDSLIVRYQDLEEMLPLAQAAFVRVPNFFRVLPVPETDPETGGVRSMMSEMAALVYGSTV